MNGVVTIPLGELAPYDLQWFHVMSNTLPRSVRTDYPKHARLIEDKANLIPRVGSVKKNTNDVVEMRLYTRI